MALDKSQHKLGDLPITLSTFIYSLYAAGYECKSQQFTTIFDEIANCAQLASLEQTARRIQSIVSAELMHEPSTERITHFLQQELGASEQRREVNEIASDLVFLIRGELDNHSTSSTIINWLEGLFYLEAAAAFSSSTETLERNELIKRIRQYSLQSSIPWLAKIAVRKGDCLEEQWVMVNQFVDWVSCLDPYPFDDVEEQFSMPVEDFMVRWELAGSQVVYIPTVDSLANLF